MCSSKGFTLKQAGVTGFEPATFFVANETRYQAALDPGCGFILDGVRGGLWGDVVMVTCGDGDVW